MKNLIALVVTLAVVLPTGAAFAQEAAAPAVTVASLVGDWKVSGKAGADKKRLASIEKTLEDENILVRNLGDDKLDDLSKISDYVNITGDEKALVIKTLRHDYKGPVDGSTFTDKTKGSDEKLKISRVLKGNKIVETVHSEGGVRTNTYILSADGTKLTWASAVKSKKLEKTFKWSVTYKK